MKLNYNCVRELLLFSEEYLTYSTCIRANDVVFPDFSSDDIVYSAEKLIEAGYLQGSVNTFIGGGQPGITITSISFEGHQFLDNIRDDGVWKDTKKALSKFSSVSLGVINTIATQILTSLINSQLGL